MTISADWFQASVIGTIFKNPSPEDVVPFGDDVFLMKSEIGGNGNRFFQYIYDIYLHGEKFATIQTMPREGSVLDSCLSIMKIENHILYQRGWIARFDYVMDSLGVSFSHVTQLDVAVDCDSGRFLADYASLVSGQKMKFGKAKAATEHGTNFSIEGGYVGSRKSDKFIKIYDKTEELNQCEHKTYIREMWKANGLNTDTVQRLELTVRRDMVKRIKDFDYTRLEDPNYLAGIMRSMLDGFYEFYTPDGDSNVSRKKKIQAIDWTYFETENVVKEPKTNKPNVVWYAQRAVTFDMRESYAGLELKNTDSLWSNAYARSYERCEKYGILDWFENRLVKWQKDKKYHDLMREKVSAVTFDRVFKRKSAAAFTEF